MNIQDIVKPAMKGAIQIPSFINQAAKEINSVIIFYLQSLQVDFL